MKREKREKSNTLISFFHTHILILKELIDSRIKSSIIKRNMIITSLYTNLQNALTTSIVYHVYMYCVKDREYSKRKIDEYERENEFCDMIIDNKM